MRNFAFPFITIGALVLSACDGLEGDTEVAATQVDLDQPDRSGEEGVDAGIDETVGADQTIDETGTTPMAERVATIGLLNKRNNVSKDFEISPGGSIEDGPVILTLAACERTQPFEFPEETGAFIQVDVLERGDTSHTRIFSGWLFKENPSLNVVEHPVYDVWVKDCKMSFPGD